MLPDISIIKHPTDNPRVCSWTLEFYPGTPRAVTLRLRNDLLPNYLWMRKRAIAAGMSEAELPAKLPNGSYRPLAFAWYEKLEAECAKIRAYVAQNEGKVPTVHSALL